MSGGSSAAPAPVVDVRIRRMSDSTAKAYIRYIQVLFVLCFVVLAVQAVWVQLDFFVPHARERVLGMNIACGIISLILLSIYGLLSWRDWRRNSVLVPDVRRTSTGRVHVPRRAARYFRLAVVDYVFIVAVIILFMSSDIYLLTDECGWVSSQLEVVSFFKWTLFSGIISNQFCHLTSMLPKASIVKVVKFTRTGWYFRWRRIDLTDGVELPWSVYAGVFALFFIVPFVCVFVGLLTATGIIGPGKCRITLDQNEDCALELAGYGGSLPGDVCDPFSASCQQFIEGSELLESGRTTSIIIACAVLMFNVFLYVACLLRLASALHPMPYKPHKLVHMLLGYHILTRIPMSVLLILNFIFLWLIQIGTCPVEFLASSGFGSMCLALAGVSAAGLWFTTPVAYGKDHEEGEIAFDDDANTNKEMKISYTRMLESFVWAYAVYEVDEMRRHEQMFDMEEFMDAFGLDDYDVLWNKHVDSKCMIAWNASTGKIVVSFRGTASGRNVLSDLKLWREPHEPERGNYWLGTQPMVHSGFSEFFYRSGMRKDCLGLLDEIINAGEGGGKGGIGENAGVDGVPGAAGVAGIPGIGGGIGGAGNAGYAGNVGDPPDDGGLNPEDPTTPTANTAPKWDILLAGHSLGAAAAQIAAYDISEWLEAKGVSFHISCYKIGRASCRERV